MNRRSDAVHWTLVAFAADCCWSGCRSADDVSCGCSIGGWPAVAAAGEGLLPAEWRPSAESCLLCSTKHEQPDWTSSVPGSASAASDGVGWNSFSPIVLPLAFNAWRPGHGQLVERFEGKLHYSKPAVSLRVLTGGWLTGQMEELNLSTN